MKNSLFPLWLGTAALVAGSAADAAPVRKRAPVTRSVIRVLPKPAPPPAPDYPTTPGIMVPMAVTLVRPTPIEAGAHAVWTLRAALNVAALQCQYSFFLRTVDNYNNMLRKHGSELARAQRVVQGHFLRTVKRGAMASFDRYNTRSYNSFSTLDAQYNFCWAAAQAGQALRMADVGSMRTVAEAMLPKLRAALAHVPPAAGLAVPPLPPLPAVDLPDPGDLEAQLSDG